MRVYIEIEIEMVETLRFCVVFEQILSMLFDYMGFIDNLYMIVAS